MTYEKELQEIEQLCGCTPTPDIISGWNAAKDGIYTPPYNFTRERTRDWVKGNKAFRNRVFTVPDNLTPQEAYQLGFKSYFQNGGELINPFKGMGILEHRFADGWAQALRRQPTPKFDKAKYQEKNSNTLQDKYQNWGSSSGSRDVESKVNKYKLMKDGE